MARKKKRKGGYRRKSRKRGAAKPVPRTMGGMWRAAPMAVKAGGVLSGLEVATHVDEAYGKSPVEALVSYLKGEGTTTTQLATITKNQLLQPSNYKLLGGGFVVHWVNKKTVKIRGL